MIRFVAYGLPGPQGSKSFKGMRSGKPILVESSAQKVKVWRQSVEIAARNALVKHNGGKMLTGPIYAVMVFTMPRPKQKYKDFDVPYKQPDLSKLLRSTEDALTTARIYEDDARIVEYLRAAKVFPCDGGSVKDALEKPGVYIELYQYDELKPYRLL